MYNFMQRQDRLGTTDPDSEHYQYYEVHCGKCNWWGMISQMRAIFKPNPSKLGDVIKELGCPMCLTDEHLEYKDESIGRLEQALLTLSCTYSEVRVAFKELRERIVE